MKKAKRPHKETDNILYNFGGASDIANQEIPKFWSMATISEDEAEITMYGDIVSSRPVNWWTQEPIQGLFISPKGFLEDIEKIKDKSKITVRINSVGGDLYTALAISTQLKSLKGETIAIIDGIAASAATVLAMGCDIIKIAAGGLFMIHDALMILSGYYNKKTLDQVAKRLEAANKSAAETYASKTKLDIKDIRALMIEESWMTGREAVEKGFIDELLFEETNIEMTLDHKEIIVNGHIHNVEGFRNLPSTIPIVNSVRATVPVMNPQIQTDSVALNMKQSKGGNQTMTAEELKQKHPDLVLEITNQVIAQATSKAIADERSRIKDIEAIEATVGDSELIMNAKYGENACTAQELAFLAMKKQAEIGVEHIKNVKTDFVNSGAGQIAAIPNAGAGEDGEIEQIRNEESNAIAMITNQYKGE